LDLTRKVSLLETIGTLVLGLSPTDFRGLSSAMPASILTSITTKFSKVTLLEEAPNPMLLPPAV
jgi:hypothetical protein